jgi:predicted permease
MSTLRQDLRSALRSARRTPGVTAVIVVSLALGIAACTAMLCVAYGLLLRPLPFRRPEEILAVLATAPAGVANPDPQRISLADALDLQARSRAFSGVGTYFENFGLTFDGGREPERVTAALVSARLLPLLGVEPILGRQIREEEDRRGADPVVLLGYDLWQRRFGGDPGVVGRIIQANSVRYRVLGVMPRGFSFPQDNEAWVQLGIQSPLPTQMRTLRRFRVLGRLKPGASLDTARRDMAEVARRLSALDPADAGWTLDAVPLRRALIGPNLRRSILALLAAVLSVLLIACVNVTGLLLARALESRQEIALRAALGARPGRVVRQLLTESLLLALAGGAVGLPMGAAAVRLLRGLLPPLPYGFALAADPPALAAAFVLILLAGLLCGIAPAVQVCRPDLGRMFLRGGPLPGLSRGGDRRSGRLHAGLIVAEVALSTILLISASLAVRTFTGLSAQKTGVAEHRLLTVWIQLSGERYLAPEARARAVQALAARVAAAPGIEAAAAADFVPLSVDNGAATKVEAVEGGPPAGGGTALCSTVTSGFFSAVGAPLLAGRDLTPAEGATQSSAAVVSATLAQWLWPGGHAVGRRLRVSGNTVTGCLTVVGVAGDLKTHSLREESQAQIFVSAAYNHYRPSALLVRTALLREAALAAVRSAVHAADPGIPVFTVATMDEVRNVALHVERLSGGALTLFAAAALFLAAVGTYGVLAMAMVRRRREIAVRLALGAPRGSLVRRLVGGGIALASAGLLLGLLAGLAVSRSLAGQLFGVAPTDPVTYAGVSILLLDVAFIACWLPARRALDVDPAEALRQE